jgi:hypothetical protein
MESIIHKYLTRHYELSSSEEASKKLRLTVTYGIYHREQTEWGKKEAYNVDLLDEIEKIFGVDELKAKAYVNNWAKSINRKINLSEYWSKLKSLMPMAMKVAAQTIGRELVSVQPMNAPTGLLTFLDYTYSGDTPDRNDRVYHQEVVERNEERERQSWWPIVEAQAAPWQVEKLTKLMENQRIFVSSRKKEE